MSGARGRNQALEILMDGFRVRNESSWIGPGGDVRLYHRGYPETGSVDCGFRLRKGHIPTESEPTGLAAPRPRWEAGRRRRAPSALSWILFREAEAPSRARPRHRVRAGSQRAGEGVHP